MPQQEKLLSHIFIRVNGADLQPDLMDDLLQVEIDSNLYLPDMFVICVHDEGLEHVDGGPFELGAQVEIGVKGEDSGQEEKLIAGEIIARTACIAARTHRPLPRSPTATSQIVSHRTRASAPTWRRRHRSTSTCSRTIRRTWTFCGAVPSVSATRSMPATAAL